jgi:hypothetical protein
MKFCLLFIVAILGMQPGLAQNGYGSTSIYDRALSLPKNTHFFVLPPNSHWYDQPWRDSVYLLPEFQEGRIELDNGYSPTHHLLMNYSLFFEMFVIKQEDSEVIPFKYSNEIRYVWIGNHKFIYSKPHGYLEIIEQGKASLAESTFMNSIYEYSNGMKYGNTVADVRTAVSKTTRFYYVQNKYYIVRDSSHHLLRSSPAALPKIFRKQKSKIREYAKEHKTDYKKREDLLEIVSYCNRKL